MNRIDKKRAFLAGGIVLLLLAILAVTVILQLESTLPVITFNYGPEGLRERESEIVPKVFSFDWKHGPKEQAQNGTDAANVGYATVMAEEFPSFHDGGADIGFSFDVPPKSVSVSVYDYEGNKVDYQPNLTEFVIHTPLETGDFLYVLEGVWEKGTCGYAFWITIQ